MPIIYIDVLVVLNWFIDWLLLLLTAQLLHQPVRRVRAVLGAAVGGLLACQVLISVPPIIALLLNLCSAAAIVRAAFVWRGVRGYVKQMFTFYCVSALLSGIVTALWYVSGSEAVVTRNGVIYCDISPFAVAVLSVIAYGAIRLYERFTRKRAPEALDYTVTVNDGCGTAECKALFDTGLHLREPFSGVPVIVVDRSALLPFLPLPLGATLANTTTVLSPRLRMVPYKTVGGNGLLQAFVPQTVTIKRAGEPKRDISGVYVALSDDMQCGEYTALIGSDVWDWQ